VPLLPALTSTGTISFPLICTATLKSGITNGLWRINFSVNTRFKNSFFFFLTVFHSARPCLLKHWLRNHQQPVLAGEPIRQKTIVLLGKKLTYAIPFKT